MLQVIHWWGLSDEVYKYKFYILINIWAYETAAEYSISTADLIIHLSYTRFLNLLEIVDDGVTVLNNLFVEMGQVIHIKFL